MNLRPAKQIKSNVSAEMKGSSINDVTQPERFFLEKFKVSSYRIDEFWRTWSDPNHCDGPRIDLSETWEIGKKQFKREITITSLDMASLKLFEHLLCPFMSSYLIIQSYWKPDMTN